FQKNECLSNRRDLWVSEVSASIPAVSAAIGVSSVSVVPQFRDSVPQRASLIVPFPSHVYVHVPFCARRCTYCDFSIAVRRIVPVDEYVAAVKRELEIRFPETSDAPVETLYFGGGTPSRLGGEGVASLIAMLRRRLHLVGDAEVTLETNPEDVNANAIARW